MELNQPTSLALPIPIHAAYSCLTLTYSRQHGVAHDRCSVNVCTATANHLGLPIHVRALLVFLFPFPASPHFLQMVKTRHHFDMPEGGCPHFVPLSSLS